MFQPGILLSKNCNFILVLINQLGDLVGEYFYKFFDALFILCKLSFCIGYFMEVFDVAENLRNRLESLHIKIIN